MSVKSCIFCVNYSWDETRGCETCGDYAHHECNHMGGSYLDGKSQKELIVIGMTCPYFKLDAEIQRLIDEKEKSDL